MNNIETSTLDKEMPLAPPQVRSNAESELEHYGAIHRDCGIDGRKQTLLKYLGGIAIAFLPFILMVNDPYWLNIIAFTYLMGGLAAAWNIIGGFAGQFSLGHGVFFGIGAYVTARFYTLFDVSPWLSMIPAALFAALIAVLISWPTFRLRGPFFAIATMAFNEVAFVIANHFDSLTNGPSGILIPFKPGFANMIFVERWQYGLLMFVFAALVIGITVLLRRSRLGYYLLAVREDEDAARAAGINVLSVKLRGMALSAGLTSIGGTLFAMYLRYIDPPTLFTMTDVGVKFALITLIGGIGTIAGPLLGAALIIPFENFLRAELASALPGINLAILGFLMVLAALFMKRGLVGALTDLWRKLELMWMARK
ncbi:branched-chain amino acid ABC transporter permease [Glaciimonas sp. PAMC28666]|uniref:branched-chain amino acid ABC transporter permease n=1 Tax=Glaciimonas sp. PAMC28666 TaxID=2807626 RepID=UPI001963297A|nr:branched-chain amino acid ABC transporter permease [Glaciimonas sp. PAMC28666]QRX81098.1 branched-chain amino acid ABC transporter permease [Glaciimonas sp. PAMC28666]